LPRINAQTLRWSCGQQSRHTPMYADKVYPDHSIARTSAYGRWHRGMSHQDKGGKEMLLHWSIQYNTHR
jgi:hypothetical protein